MSSDELLTLATINLAEAHASLMTAPPKVALAPESPSDQPALEHLLRVHWLGNHKMVLYFLSEEARAKCYVEILFQ